MRSWPTCVVQPDAAGALRCRRLQRRAGAALRKTHAIDVFVDEPRSNPARPAASAHDFVWRHRQAPYDLTVYQLGNSSHHDYRWPYLFRYPGLVVLHDVRLHHARAAALLRRERADDYRARVRVEPPAVSPDLAELAVAGFDSPLYYAWPMTRLIAQSARRVAVHTRAAARELERDVPRGRLST